MAIATKTWSGQGISLTLEGVEEATANLKRWMEDAPYLVAKAFYDEMDDLMMESQAECPYDYNNPHDKPGDCPHLRDTAKTTQEIEGDTITTYGSYDTPYAVYVHEILEYHHDPPTKAKYLEDPATRRSKYFMTDIMERMGNFYAGITDPIMFSEAKAASIAARAQSRKETTAIRKIPQQQGGRFV